MSQDVADLAQGSASLSPLPPVMNRGLTAIVFFSSVSLVSIFPLLVALSHSLLSRWRRQTHCVQNQFLFLIFNLLLADLQQAIAFFINVEWLAHGGINVDSPSCFAQGWFVSVGDLASGWWAVAISLHTFACIALSYQISARSFYTACASIWGLVFLAAVLGVETHSDDLYVRAGAWCWINAKYPRLRLWGHYFWIFIAEFGTVFLYGTLFWIIRRRIKTNHFCPTKTAKAQQAAYMVVIYPLVYVVCTLPLASARLQSIMGVETSMEHLCLAGAMIACTGWLDVMVYCATRKVFTFSPDEPNHGPLHAETDMIETFQSAIPFWKNRQHFGTTTIIEAGGTRNSSYFAMLERQDSTELLAARPPPAALLAVKTETTVVVSSEPMELSDIAGVTYAESTWRAGDKDSLNSDSKENDCNQAHDGFP